METRPLRKEVNAMVRIGENVAPPTFEATSWLNRFGLGEKGAAAAGLGF
jgi:hypothetical protein